jgi:TonB family protein
MEVLVRFSPGTSLVTDIRQGVSAGVPGCISAPLNMVRISPDVMQRRLLRQINPIYPPDAQVQQFEPFVTLRIHVDTAGSVISADKVNGPDALVPAAIEAVRQWKYEPTLFNGTPVAVETTVEVNFTFLQIHP